MNRKSLFGRLADSKKAFGAAERQEYFRAHLEPLEDRKLLVSRFVSHDWTITTDISPAGLSVGDTVTDFVNGVTGQYGTTAFGTLTGGSFVAGSEYISNAIAASTTNDTVEVQPGTYAESDIVVTVGVTLTGSDSNNKPVIVPETGSANTTGDFPSGTHSGIIIYEANVTVRDLVIDGTGNGFTRDFHHGVTTLYDTPGGGTVRNGTLSLKTLGPAGPPGSNSSVPDILIDGVEVRNLFWHGITMSPLVDRSFDPGAGDTENLIIMNSTVNDVGDVKDINRVGILVQNINDTTSGSINLIITSQPTAYFNTVSSVGVGVRTTFFGTLVFGNENAANNGAILATNEVYQASVYGFDFQGSDEDFQVGNIATNSGALLDVGTGVNIKNADPVFSGLHITGFHIGMHAQDVNTYDSNATQRMPRLALDVQLSGPGSTASGSVGLLLDNDVTTTDSASALLGAALISDWEVGIKSEQTVSATDFGRKNHVLILGTFMNDNGTDILIGENAILEGGLSLVVNPGKIEVTGTGMIDPRIFNYERAGDEIYQLNPGNSATPDFAPENAEQVIAGSFELSSSSRYDVTITGQTEALTYEDFELPLSYTNQTAAYIATDPPFTFGLRPDTNDFRRLTGTLNAPAATMNGYTATNVTQDAGNSGFLTFDATGGTGLDAIYRLYGHDDPNNSSIFILDPVDLSNSTYIDLALKLNPGNTSETITFSLIDARGNNVLWPFPLDSPPLTTSGFTTFHINLVTPSIPLFGPDDDRLDLTNIAGFMFFGENGFLDLNGADNLLKFSVGDIKTTSRENSVLVAGGSIDLGGATLTADIRTGFTPTSDQEFTIVNNTHASNPVTGTFAGLAEGAAVTLDGVAFTISYTGGTGNDVVLTEGGESFSSTVTGRRLFYNNSIWDNPGYGFTNASAIAGDKSAYVPTGANTTTFANMSSYSKGLNGVMVELTGTHGTITASDFTFRMSPQFTFFNNSPGTWASAPAPLSVTLVPDTPASGTDRYEIIWADSAITNRYLYVLVEGNDSFGGSNTNTGLATSDDFFFGNFIGDVGTPEFYPNVNALDQVQVRNNQGSVGPPTGILNLFDFNRDALIDAGDQIIARNNQGAMGWLALSAGPFGPEAAPAGEGDGDSGVASALAASGSGGSATPDWVAARLESASSESGPAASAVAQLMEADSPDGGSDGADDAEDDDVLDTLLDDLS